MIASVRATFLESGQPVDGKPVLYRNADGQRPPVLDAMFVNIRLDIHPKRVVLPSVVENENERVSRLPVPVMNVGHFHDTRHASSSVNELRSVRRFYLELDPAVLDLPGLWRKVQHQGIGAILRFGHPPELVSATENLPFQEVDAHLRDHVFAGPAFVLTAPTSPIHVRQCPYATRCCGIGGRSVSAVSISEPSGRNEDLPGDLGAGCVMGTAPGPSPQIGSRRRQSLPSSTPASTLARRGGDGGTILDLLCLRVLRVVGLARLDPPYLLEIPVHGDLQWR
jgi:hypothetical protein